MIGNGEVTRNYALELSPSQINLIPKSNRMTKPMIMIQTWIL